MTTGTRLSADLAEALGRCTGLVADSHTLPAACYVDPEVAALEAETVFRQGWVGIGRGDRWTASGDYAAMDLGGVPVVVVRDEEGALRAYANTCRHRSSQVMEGEGHCTKMRCPFHFWTYGLDGRLLGAPSMRDTNGFERADYGLPEFMTAERYGFAFVSLEDLPPPIDDWLGDFPALHARWDLGSMITTRRREFTVSCNWKAFAEVFNEYYHLPYVHPGSIDDTYDDPDDPEVVVGAWATHSGTTQGTGGLLEVDQTKALPVIGTLNEREARGVRYSWLYPTLVIATGAEGMWMYEVYPDGPDRCRCAQVVCFPPETAALDGFAEVAEAYYERFDVAIAEDIPMLEQQHRGMRSPFARQGRFSYLEPNVARFAGWYADRLLSVG
ncbi:MAG: aromatic ring-hydroxylating dioxygenase subunit alpha [Actinomycetota bacterium]|nr:aromatic ring-hydroxylating dioxygenase subunit alpha [Actinomycetota bacterium]MEE3354271.1 aromatic ring-hydroxylating dioxygenase subunit alpha [Actinomycetota bacterium]